MRIKASYNIRMDKPNEKVTLDGLNDFIFKGNGGSASILLQDGSNEYLKFFKVQKHPTKMNSKRHMGI